MAAIVSEADAGRAQLLERAATKMRETLAAGVEPGLTRHKMPLAFASDDVQANVLAVRALLDFGSGYEELVQGQMNRSVKETQTFGVMHMHICGKELDAEFLKSVNYVGVAEHFALKGVTEEEEVMGGVYKEVHGPLMPYAARLVRVMNDTGEELERLGKPSLGAFVMDKLRAGASCRELTSALAYSFAGFRDSATDAAGAEVPLRRKAVLLAHDLADAFGERYGASFADLAELPAPVDADTASALAAAGLLDLLPGDGNTVQADTAEGRKAEQALRVKAAALADELRVLVPAKDPREAETLARAAWLGDAPRRLRVQGTVHY